MTNTKNNQKKEMLFKNNDFNQQLIDSLPGIFYLYHVTKEEVFLKWWNKKHVTELEYSDQELQNISASVFYTEKEFIRVRKAIAEIFEKKGWNDIHTTLISKSGKRVPYYLQGYAVDIDGKKYFMGVGINTTKELSLKTKLRQKEKEHLKQQIVQQKVDTELKFKKRELLTYIIEETHMYEVFEKVQGKISILLAKHSGTEVYNDLQEIDILLKQQLSSSENWEIFRLRFKEIYPDFFEKLKEKHPALSKTELKFCAYLRLQLSSSQIASVLNISSEGIRKNRYRIRKKMGLCLKNSLEDYIYKF